MVKLYGQGGWDIETSAFHRATSNTSALAPSGLPSILEVEVKAEVNTGEGWYPEVLAGMASISVKTFAGTPIHEAYLKTSPRPEGWPTFVAKMRQLLSEDYDWAEGVAALKSPTLILVGDADGLRLAHAVEFFGLLGGGKADGDLAGLPPAELAVLPNTTHVGWAPRIMGS
jgi:hypothetical protein